MKRLAWFAALLFSCLSACSINDGQCWIDPGQADGIGAGGGPIAPYGTGGFGDAPDKKPQAATDPPECNLIGSYDASLFKFTTTLPDDGTDVAGGVQAATATVKFVDGRQDPPASWSCGMTIEVAIRSATYGKISAEYAAEMSAEVLTDTASATMHSRDAWVPAAFCINLRENMQTLFGKRYPGAGARVKAP